MAKVLKIKKEHQSGIYDSDTNKDCVTEKVVDITDNCPNANERNRCILLFTRAVRGRIVQIAHPYEHEVYTGVKIHFFIDELDREMCVAERDDTFGSHANKLGLTKQALRNLIEMHAPNP